MCRFSSALKINHHKLTRVFVIYFWVFYCLFKTNMFRKGNLMTQVNALLVSWVFCVTFLVNFCAENDWSNQLFIPLFVTESLSHLPVRLLHLKIHSSTSAIRSQMLCLTKLNWSKIYLGFCRTQKISLLLHNSTKKIGRNTPNLARTCYMELLT